MHYDRDMEIGEDFEVYFLKQTPHYGMEAYYYFMGERPEDYDLIHFDPFFFNSKSIFYDARRAVLTLSNKGFLDPHYFFFEQAHNSPNISVRN